MSLEPQWCWPTLEQQGHARQWDLCGVGGLTSISGQLILPHLEAGGVRAASKHLPALGACLGSRKGAVRHPLSWTPGRVPFMHPPPCAQAAPQTTTCPPRGCCPAAIPPSCCFWSDFKASMANTILQQWGQYSVLLN